MDRAEVMQPRARAQKTHPEPGLDPEVDPVRLARLLRKAHEFGLRTGESPSMLRKVVARSWQRAASAGVDPDRPAPKILDDTETARSLARHPVSPLLPLIESMLIEAAGAARYLAALSDAHGLLLWADGHPQALESAVGPAFLPGHQCSESVVGTNAVGTALELDHPVQIFSAEHFNRRLHGWTCSAAPIHDPENGEILGALDVSGSYRTGHPHSLPLVSAVARMVESRLSERLARRTERLKALYFDRIAHRVSGRSALVNASGRVLAAAPTGWIGRQIRPVEGSRAVLDNGIPVIVEPIGAGGAQIVWQASGRQVSRPKPKLLLEGLGRIRARLSFGGQSFDLRPRLSEIMCLLALNPEGLSCAELGAQLYGRGFSAGTVRVETSRLRQVLGPVLKSNPYRLDARVDTDSLQVEHLLERGDLAAAVERYAGELLPASKVPAITEARSRLRDAIEGRAGAVSG